MNLLMVIQNTDITFFYFIPEDVKKDKLKDNHEELKKLGNRIKALRVKAGFSNYEYFAYKHEIPRAQFGRYERGEDLRYSSLLKVIKAFDITLKEFFSEGFD